MLSQRFFQVAGQLDSVILILLVMLSVVSIAIIFERWFHYRKLLQNQDEVDKLLNEALLNPSPANLAKIESVSSPESAFFVRLRDYLDKYGENGVEELYSSYLTQQKFSMERYLGFLATIGSNAPYIGLLGTVLGIMKSFHDLAAQSEAGVQSVMAGISSALLATAAGLFVAIPAVMAYNYFLKKVKLLNQRLSIVRDLVIMARRSGRTS